MPSQLAGLLQDVPREVPWHAVVERGMMDERRACIDVLFSNIIGVNLGYVEWCPNDDPPSLGETFAWIWFIRPDLTGELAQSAPPVLRTLMEYYSRVDLAGWWNRPLTNDGGWH